MYLLFLRLHYIHFGVFKIVYTDNSIIKVYITFFQKYDYFIQHYKLKFTRSFNVMFWVYSEKYIILFETTLSLKFIKKYINI